MILPSFLFKGNERHLQFKNIILCRIIFLHCIPQWKKTSSFLSHNGKKPLPLYPTTEKNLSVLSHNRGKYLPLWDTTEENLQCCGIQCGRFFCVGSHNFFCVVLWDIVSGGQSYSYKVTPLRN